MVASEMEPFAKTGGLADVVGALSPALAKRGVEVHAFMPGYAGVKETGPKARPAPGVTVHFIEHPEYFSRPALYGGPDGDYPDNLDRFSYFCRQVFERMRAEKIRPDLIHAHDWQAALSVVYLAHLYREDPFFANLPSVFTIHNLAYQGLFSEDQFPKLGLPWSLFSIDGLEFYDRVNLLKGGLVFARALTTVSPSYAREIQSPGAGEGLDGVLRARSGDLVGILNGIDTEAWNPASDRAIPSPFDWKRLKGKARDKEALQKEVGLPVSADAFLVGMVTRLASQKGVDLVVEALPRLNQMGVQLVILGSGDRTIEEALKAAGASSSVRVRLVFDNALAHRIYAGSDAFLMPSRYEPCGLGQMIAMRYGTVPIVRATGGLADTVFEASTGDPKGNGFCFQPLESRAVTEAVGRALERYRNRSDWRKLQQRGMSADFSWTRSAQEYLKLYEKLVQGHVETPMAKSQ